MTHGLIEYGSIEFFNPGLADHSHMNLIKIYESELKQHNSYPKNCIPLHEMGDGHYALYDVKTSKVIEWCQEGVVKDLSNGLNNYLSDLLTNV